MIKLGILGCVWLILPFPTPAQQRSRDPRLSEAEFVLLAGRCAPTVPAETLLAVARTESSLRPNAISINYPRASARRAGYREGEIILSRQPVDRLEAIRWMHWLLSHHLTVSLGLMQVNVETAHRFRADAEQLLDPCTNLRVGANILTAAYTAVAQQTGQGFPALDTALSLFNTGSAVLGFRNGYVANVYAHARDR